jgi:hypothetical protein
MAAVAAYSLDDDDRLSLGHDDALFLPHVLWPYAGAPGLDSETWETTALNHNIRNHALRD